MEDVNIAKITRKDIIASLKSQYPELSNEKLERVLEVAFEEIAAALVCGDRVELRGFASMVVRKRDSRLARNPRTNKKVAIGGKGSLYFRASRELIAHMNA